ncbi:type II toxin-antitoxin system prevent-host-death family antitoxin [Paenibacillus alkalitolerans]|uniref:type II toxin-antitoxin system prevent-host-death family antitoxin n=1 Tax=Paenibacillus alkalitolerans TaxID=2799335 RepID=UPI0018F3F8A3|nr:type II toxin-antitoxin system prevent-host-death family antitoxin [Paenibacillus alkalitolerans]
MIVNSTEMQNNFGKYLMIAAQEDIVITRNGTAIARLTAINKEAFSDRGAAKEIVMEKAASYHAGGRKASYEEFLELTKNSEDRYEYIDGEIFFLASPRTAHQIALAELFVIFHSWFQGSKCTPLMAPYDITLYRTADSINVVQPDIMVICDLEEHLDEDDYYKGVPALVVEIISESTRRKDLVKKLDLYMSCGISEYWIVNPINREVAVYTFEDKNISRNITFKNSETAESCIFEGLTAELERIFK